MRKIFLNESQFSLINISEDVFASKKRGKNKLQLSYNKRQSSAPTKNFGNLYSPELLNTGKMDQNNADTYEVPLKGNIMSYNITSIKGTEIMHYFKNKYAEMCLDLDGDGEKETYELFMEIPEYNEFFKQFYNKVNNVISYVTNKLYKESDGKINFSGVSIYPVPSSSKFNEMVSEQLQNNVKFNGLPVVKINSGIFEKNLSNLQKDTEFVNKNKDYYSGKMLKYGDDPTTHEQYLDKMLKDYTSKEAVRNKIKTLIIEYNFLYHKLDRFYGQYKNSGSRTFCNTLAKHYTNLYYKYMEILAALKEGRKRAIDAKTMFKVLKSSKPHVEQRKTEAIWKLVEPFVKDNGVTKIEMHELEPINFQIKSLPNQIRMGMKNYFIQNPELIQQELEKIKGTIFVIFDDNISGGATLSDICLQAKQLGIEYIIPITFGEMQKKYNISRAQQTNAPTGPNGTFKNY